MEHRNQLADALVNGGIGSSLCAQKAVCADLQVGPEKLAELRAEAEQRERQWAKQRKAAAILNITETLVACQNIEPETALKTATSLWDLAEKFTANTLE